MFWRSLDGRVKLLDQYSGENVFVGSLREAEKLAEELEDILREGESDKS